MNRKRWRLWTGVALLLALPAAERGVAAEGKTGAGSKFGNLGNLHATTARMPFYKDRRLEFYVRSDQLNMQGSLIHAEQPVIDIIRKGAAVEEVARHSGEAPEIYPLDARLPEVLRFWAGRPYSEGVLRSASAEIDQTNQVATGRDKVFVRSPMLDLNGVGFSADFTSRIITVNSNVEIVLRGDGGGSLGSGLDLIGSAPSGKDPEKKKKAGVTRVFCDLLTLDLNKNIVILTGNVKVFAPEGNIASDQLELEFESRDFRRDAAAPPASDGVKKNGAAASEGSAPGESDGSPLSGGRLRLVRFLGKVHAVRNLPPDEAAQGVQYARAERVVYNLPEDSMELSGNRPRMGRGGDFAEADRILLSPKNRVVRLFDRCRLEYRQQRKEGGAAAASPNVITSEYMEWSNPARKVFFSGGVLWDVPMERSRLAAEQAEIFLAEGGNAPSTRLMQGNSKLRAEKVVTSGAVKMERRGSGELREEARAGKMIYTARDERIVLENQPVLLRGDDRIEGRQMEYLLSEERLKVHGDSLIRLNSVAMDHGGLLGEAAGQGGRSTGGAPMRIRSCSSDLNMKGNRLDFVGDVRAEGRDGMRLACDTLGIDLADRPDKKSAAPGPKNDTGGKVPVRALAVGNVVVEDAASRMETGELEVLFGEHAVPGKTDAEKIFARKSVKIRNIPAGDGRKKPSGLMARRGDTVTTLTADHGELDLLTDEADFYRQVKVEEPGLELTCEHLKAVAAKTSSPVPDLASYRAREEFPDRIAVGEGRELVKVIGNDNVRIRRNAEHGTVQRAAGDHAVYEVAKRTVVLTADAPRKPQAHNGQSGMTGDKVTIELDTEDIVVDNGDILAPTQGLGF